MANLSIVTNGLKLHTCFTELCNKLQSPLLFLIRLIWGFSFVQTGLGKWHNIQNVVQFLTDLQIPFPIINAYLVATVELVCGGLLILGLLSRLATIPLITTLIIAYLTTEQEAIHALFSNPNFFLTATPFPFLMASVLILAFGPGIFSVDHLIKQKTKRKINILINVL